MLTAIFAATACDKGSFFFFPHWWKYLNTSVVNGQCQINFNFPSDIWLVALAITEMLLRFAGLAAIISIIIAGVTYIASGGNPENAAKARRRIYNSLIGLAIVFVASGVVGFLGSRFGG